jgi:DNA-binding NarL/FixJ family response regulator
MIDHNGDRISTPCSKFDPELFTDDRSPYGGHINLTPAQINVARHLVGGQSTIEIANGLLRAEGTIKQQLLATYKALKLEEPVKESRQVVLTAGMWQWGINGLERFQVPLAPWVEQLANDDPIDLTPKQASVSVLVTMGFGRTAISGMLDVTVKTVSNHLSDIYDRFTNYTPVPVDGPDLRRTAQGVVIAMHASGTLPVALQGMDSTSVGNQLLGQLEPLPVMVPSIAPPQ